MPPTRVNLILTEDQYFSELKRIHNSIDITACHLMLGAETVIRTWVFNSYYDWFDDRGLDVMDHYFCAELDDGTVPLVGCKEVEGDITITFSFLEEDSSMGLLFKLTFGGNV